MAVPHGTGGSLADSCATLVAAVRHWLEQEVAHGHVRTITTSSVVPLAPAPALDYPGGRAMKYGKSVLIGALVLILVLAYVRLFGVKSEFEYVILRTFMALAGGYAAAGLLGTIEVKNQFVKATGGFAVAVLLFLTNPVGGLAIQSASPEKKEQLEAVDSLLTS